MVIWTGAGILVPIIAGIIFVTTQLTVDALLMPANYYQNHLWPKLVACAVSGILIWICGTFFERKTGRKLVDPETNEVVTVGNSHSLFFIPFKWWAPIMVLVGIGLSIQAFTGKSL